MSRSTEVPAEPQLGVEALAAMYRDMSRIRRFEETAAEMFRGGEIPGFLHLSIGQEAVPVGISWPLRDEDVITSNHRGHGHVLAKGADVGGMFSELMGRRGGTCAGRGGSMHIADVSLGIFGANGIVGAGLPIACGAAQAAKMREAGDVAVAYFGDGALGQGAFHEAVTTACLLELPLLFVCENNQYAEFTSTTTDAAVPIERRAAGYGIRYERVDGNDVDAVAATAERLVADLRAGSGPILLEALTLRMRGHYEGDAEEYRDPERDREWAERDPLRLAEGRLVELGLTDDRLEQIRADVEREIADAVAAARLEPEPDAGELLDDVIVPRPPAPPEAEVVGEEEIRTIRAIRDALHDALADDESVFLAGIDVGRGGGVFNASKGLYTEFPGRLLDMPIAESAIVGLGLGAAMSGMRPIVEVMYLDFIGVCFDQIFNQAAKLRYMTGGGARTGLTIRTQFGAGRSSGAQHSQSLEALLAHIPGLTVLMPSTPADAYGLLRSAVDDPNPVIVIENRILYGAKGAKAPAGHRVPIGKAKVVREGGDVTVVAVSRMVQVALAAAEEAAKDGIETEVIDLRTVSPLDRDTVLDSLAKTNRLVIAHEAVTDFGIGAEIAALAADAGFWDLDAPIRRVGAAYAPAPYAPSLERAWLPDAERVRQAIVEAVA
ncbi:MAG TPA: pyruvate dehydrogenase complex E1 component subunit beta [Solirubrobacterales bacterium]|nr:pyruvate dehydrogenase complex E1 component subunit beta [Solirubrobacterales bacterium]